MPICLRPRGAVRSNHLIRVTGIFAAFTWGFGVVDAQAQLGGAAIEIHVSPTGSDASSGASASGQGADGPLKTLAAAQREARKYTAAGGQRRSVRVVIEAGSYLLDQPLVFTPADSGTPEAPVTYEAANPGSVTISGGVNLPLRKPPSGSSTAVFESPGANPNAWRGGGQLYVNGQRATLARQPKAGQYWFVKRPESIPGEPAGQTGREAFDPDDGARAWLNRLSAADRQRAVVNVMHSWTSSQHHLAALPGADGPVKVSPRARWGFQSTGYSQRYFIENVSTALDAPGEWFWDENGVRYIPRANEAGATLTAVMPILEQVLIVRGDTAGGRLVENLTFRGLTFAHTRFTTPDTGFTDSQAATDAGAAVQVDGARRLSFDKCVFNHLGGYAIWLRRAVRDSSITGSTFSDLGAGGIMMGQTKQLPGDAVPSGANTASGNVISDTGKQLPGGVGIWVGQGFDNVVANNFIHNTTYTGISMGWMWGYAESQSGRNRITDNLLVNIGTGQLSDMGGIYTLGRSPGTVISGNVIREVRAYPGYGPGPGMGAWGIYNDLGTSDVNVENNVVAGTDSGGYFLNGGRSNIVRQNLFALGDHAEIRVSKSDAGNPEVTLLDNVIVPKAAQPFQDFAEAPYAEYKGNLVADTIPGGADTDIGKCSTGCRQARLSVATAADNPRIVTVQGASTDVNSRTANALSRAGPAALPEARFRVAMSSQSILSVVAPPSDYTLNLAKPAIGTQPSGLYYQPDGNTAAIRLVENAGAPGGRCLEFDDSPTFANRFDPHAFATLSHTAGTSTGEFALVIDANSDFIYEWRDDNKPLNSGPNFHVTASGVSIGGKVVAPVKVGEWTRFKVVAPLGQAAAGRWALTVTGASGQATSVDNLAFASLGWQRLNRVYFISNTNVVSTACLASVKVSNTKQ